MAAGVNFASDPAGRWEEALAEFKKAYSYVPSWIIAGNIGTAALHVERDQEALDYYTQYLNEGGKRIDARERAQVERDVATLKASIVRVTVTTDASGVILIDERMAADGKSIVNRYPAESGGSTSLGIHPGHHRMVAKSGDKEASWDFNAEPGATLSHDFKLGSEGSAPAKAAPATRGAPAATSKTTETAPPAVAPRQRPTPTAVYVGLVGTTLLAGGAAVTGVLALNKHSSFEDKNAEGDASGAQDLKDSGQLINIVTDVLIGAAVIGAGVTGYLYFTRPEAPAERTALRVVPSLGSQGGFVTVKGQF